MQKTRLEIVNLARALSVIKQQSYAVFETENGWTFCRQDYYLSNIFNFNISREVIYINHRGGIENDRTA